MTQAAVPRTARAPLFTGPMWRLSIAHFLAALPILGLNLLPLFVRELGGRPLDIGLVMSTASISSIVSRPGIGRLMDRRGRRIAFVIAGLCNAVPLAAYLLVSDIGPLFYAIRFVHGIGAGAMFATFFTVAADLLPSDRRGQGLALFGISGMAGGGIGPFLGERLLASGGFDRLFVVFTLMATMSLAITLTLRDTRHRARSGDRLTRFRDALTDPGLTRLLPLSIAFGFAVGAFGTFLADYAHARGIGPVSTFFLTYSATSIALRLAFAARVDSFGAERVVRRLMGFTSAALVLCVAFPSSWGLVLAGVAGGIGHGFVFPSLGSLAASRCAPEHRGSSISLFTASIDVGMLLCGPILGEIAERAGYGPAYLVAAVVALAGLAHFAFVERHGAPVPGRLVSATVPDTRTARHTSRG